MNETKNTMGMPQAIVQSLAWLSLFGMFIVDKVMHIPAPPLPEYWYGVVFGVASFGKAASKLMSRRKRKT